MDNTAKERINILEFKYIYEFKWEDLSLNAGQEIIGMEAGMWEEKKMKERWLKSHEE